MKKTIIVLLLIVNAVSVLAQEGYPTPTVKDVLFYIQHSRGKNTFIYQANYTVSKDLNEKEPIKVCRQLFDLDGEVKPITNIQRKYAYGVKTEKLGHNYYEVELVSYPGQKLYLRMDKNHYPYVEGTINGQYMHVKHLFIKLKDGTSGLNVKADYILFHGLDKNGKPVKAKLYPSH